MRRFFLAVAVIPLALGLAGCGATSGPNDPTITRPYPNTVEGTTPSTTTTTKSGGGGQGDAKAGAAVFKSAGCTSCHTLKDAGSTGQVGPNLDEAKPPYALVVTRVTNGMGVMPAFKDQLTGKQIQDVAAYVSSVAGK
jgi:mono/diheme cytochrome c family protein